MRTPKSDQIRTVPPIIVISNARDVYSEIQIAVNLLKNGYPAIELQLDDGLIRSGRECVADCFEKIQATFISFQRDGEKFRTQVSPKTIVVTIGPPK